MVVLDSESGWMVEVDVAGRLYARLDRAGESSKKDRRTGVVERVSDVLPEREWLPGRGSGVESRICPAKRERGRLSARERGRSRARSTMLQGERARAKDDAEGVGEMEGS